MPKQEILSTMFMSEKELFDYREQAKKGNFYEIPGPFEDTIYVPKSVSDLNPTETRKKNQLRLQWYNRYIDHMKKRKANK